MFATCLDAAARSTSDATSTAATALEAETGEHKRAQEREEAKEEEGASSLSFGAAHRHVIRVAVGDLVVAEVRLRNSIC